MNCPKCNAVILPNDNFCEECGVPLGSQETGNQENTENKKGDKIERWEKIKTPYLAGVSDRGLCHHGNQDFFELGIIDSKTAILVVCDGVSSSQSPELAAKIAAETTCQFLQKAIVGGKTPEIALKSAIGVALTSVCHLPYQKTELSEPPSTTLVAAIVQNGVVTIGNLGDSRAYWISASDCRQLTQDDSWLTEMIESGEMTETEARKSPQAHAITRWLGDDGRDDAEPKIVVFPLPSSGYLLLCTDGLWNYASKTEEFADLVFRSPNSEAYALSCSLVEFARSQGGHDNITVAVWINNF